MIHHTCSQSHQNSNWNEWNSSTKQVTSVHMSLVSKGLALMTSQPDNAGADSETYKISMTYKLRKRKKRRKGGGVHTINWCVCVCMCMCVCARDLAFVRFCHVLYACIPLICVIMGVCTLYVFLKAVKCFEFPKVLHKLNIVPY